MKEVWKNSLSEAQKVLENFLADEKLLNNCVNFSEKLIEVYSKEGTAFSCGNGGSHCDAMHFSEELTGRFHKDRAPLGALALGDPSHMSCVGNDYGFEHIFERQLQGLGRRNDLLVALSTSGNSENVIKAVNICKEKGLFSVGLLGKDGGRLKDMVDLAIVVPSQNSGRIQEIHIKIIHTVIETVERKLFPQNYN